jgi:hypothetical protein
MMEGWIVGSWREAREQFCDEMADELAVHVEDDLRASAFDWRQDTVQLPAVVRIVIPMEDEIIHTATMPFCGDPCCPCHRDEENLREYLLIPQARGLITRAQADWIWRGGSDA